MTASEEIENIALGLTASQLARLFRTNTPTVQRKLVNVTPVGTRRNSPIYDIADAAPFLVKPVANLEEILKQMKPGDLPAALQKDYWGAQLSRQQFEEKAGKLWKTERVQSVIADMLKLVRQRVMLFNDTVERQVGLTDEQRRIIQAMSDGLLEDCMHSFVELFGEQYDAQGERDEVFENGPPVGPTIELGEDMDDGL